MGAAALVTDRDVTSRLQAYVNVESIGSAGDPMLFETGPGNGWLVDAMGTARAATARRLVRARDLPAAAERHRLLHPEAPGHPGLELRDRRRQLRVSHRARHARTPVAAHRAAHGRTVVALMTALDAVDVTQRTNTDRTYFDIGGRTAASYGPVAGAVDRRCRAAPRHPRVAAGDAHRRSGSKGVLRWLLTALWTLAGSAAVVASMVGATWALAPGARGVSPVVRAPGPTVPAPARGRRHRRLEHRAARSVAAGAGARRAPPDHRVERRPAGVDRARRERRSVLAPAAAYLWILPLLSRGPAPAPSSRSRAPSPCGRSRSSSCWSPRRCGCARPRLFCGSWSPSSGGCRS